VNVIDRVVCCCSEIVASAALDAPVICGTIFNLLTANSRCNGPDTGFANRLAQYSRRFRGGAASELGGFPDANRLTRSENCIGGSDGYDIFIRSISPDTHEDTSTHTVSADGSRPRGVHFPRFRLWREFVGTIWHQKRV